MLEGSVRKGGDRLRVTAQLIDATTGNHIWAQRYDREVADFFALQDDITSNVVATIEPQLCAAEDIRAKHKRPESLNAWDCVARALSLAMKVTKHDNATAQDLLKKAIAIDPSYAQAHSILAFSLSLANSWSWQPSESVLEPAWDFAQNAVRLDVDDPWAHLALGHLHRQRRELEDAVAEFQNAVALNPNFAFAHTHLGLALCFLGRSEEALRACRQLSQIRRGGEVNGGEEVSCGLVVAGGDGTELLELGEEILDQMARLVEVPIEVARQATVRLGRNHRSLPGGGQWHEDAFVGIEGLVGDQRFGLHRGKELVGAGQIMRLAAGQEEAQRVAECVDQGVDFRAQSSSRAPDRLVIAGFFWAPALC